MPAGVPSLKKNFQKFSAVTTLRCLVNVAERHAIQAADYNTDGLSQRFRRGRPLMTSGMVPPHSPMRYSLKRDAAMGCGWQVGAALGQEAVIDHRRYIEVDRADVVADR